MFMLTGRPFASLKLASLTETDILSIFTAAHTQPIALATSAANPGFMYPGYAHWVVRTQHCALITMNP